VGDTLEAARSAPEALSLFRAVRRSRQYLAGRFACAIHQLCEQAGLSNTLGLDVLALGLSKLSAKMRTPQLKPSTPALIPIQHRGRCVHGHLRFRMSDPPQRRMQASERWPSFAAE
jgi:hypothetical protein